MGEQCTFGVWQTIHSFTGRDQQILHNILPVEKNFDNSNLHYLTFLQMQIISLWSCDNNLEQLKTFCSLFSAYGSALPSASCPSPQDYNGRNDRGGKGEVE